MNKTLDELINNLEEPIEVLDVPDTKKHIVVNHAFIEEVRQLAADGLMQSEIAHYFDITPRHWSKLKAKYPALKRLGNVSKARGKADYMNNLKRKAYIEGDTAALLFLGKVVYGLSEKKQLEITTKTSKEVPNISGLDPIESSKIYNDFMKNN